jgi:hypothetical protein
MRFLALCEFRKRTWGEEKQKRISFSSTLVYLKRPDARLGFRHATCYLPSYTWEDIVGFTQAEIDRYQEMIESTAHLILEFSQEGGFDHAANL